MKRLVQALLGSLGLRLSRVRSGPSLNSLDSFFFILKERGFVPKHIVDIGANHGQWTRTALKYFPEAFYTLVEPQNNLIAHVKDLLTRDGRIRWIGAGAGDKLGTMALNIAYRDDSSSFVVTTEVANSPEKRQIEVPVTTLNEIVRRTDAPFPDLVKIDAEGFDLRVLAGASELFGKTDIFLLEAAICERDCENTLGKVIQTMDHLGYRLFSIHGLNNSPKYGVLWLCEVAFIRNASRLLDGMTYEDVPLPAR